MLTFMRNCFATVALVALCIWSLEPITLLPLGLCAVGFGIGALCMHIAGGFNQSGNPTIVVTAPTPASPIYVRSEPTFGRPWSWNLFNWFSSWRDDSHHGYNTHGHQPPSAFDRHQTVVTNHHHTERGVHAPTHYGSIHSSAPHVTVSSHNSYNQHDHGHSNSHGHR